MEAHLTICVFSSKSKEVMPDGNRNYRSLESIDKKVKELNSTLRASFSETRKLYEALKLDNKNTEAVLC